MNAKTLFIATLGLVAASAAFATSKSDAERQQEAQLHQPSQVSRATVLAELAQARIAGTLNVHPDHGTRAVTGSSLITRAQVLAELDAARANGELVSGDRIFVPLPVGPALSRAEVIAELARARANGELN